MPQILKYLSHGVESRKLSINPLELYHYNLIHEVSFPCSNCKNQSGYD